MHFMAGAAQSLPGERNGLCTFEVLSHIYRGMHRTKSVYTTVLLQEQHVTLADAKLHTLPTSWRSVRVPSSRCT